MMYPRTDPRHWKGMSRKRLREALARECSARMLILAKWEEERIAREGGPWWESPLLKEWWAAQ